MYRTNGTDGLPGAAGTILPNGTSSWDYLHWDGTASAWVVGSTEIVLGRASSAGTNSVAIGHNAVDSLKDGESGFSTAVGMDAKAASAYSTALDDGAYADFPGTTAVGHNAYAYGYLAIAIGYDANAGGECSIGLGYNR